MSKPSDLCVMPISEVNRDGELRAAVREMLATARFAGHAVPDLCGSVDAHPDSICAVNLVATLRVCELLKSS
jgi:hypothetical protein